MSTLAEVQSELTALKAEVARLKEDAALFFIIHRDEHGVVQDDTQLRCWMLHTEHVELAKRGTFESRGGMGLDNEGPYVSLWGDDNKARLIMRVRDNAGQLDIFDDALHPVAQMYAGEGGHGHVAVYSPGGIPRAVMKGMETGGAVTVVNEEGRPRAIMLSSKDKEGKDKGELVVMNADKPQARIFTGEAGGGVVTFDNKGDKACIMVTSPAGNSVSAFTPHKTVAATLAATAAGNALTLGTDDSNPGIQLLDLPGFGGSIYLRDKDGNKVVALTTEEAGGDISVCAPGAEGTTARLHIHNGGGIVTARRADSPSVAVITAADGGGLLAARGPDDTAATVAVVKHGGVLNIMKGTQVQGLVGVAEDGASGTIMLTNPDNSSAVNLIASKNGGTILLGGADGTTQVGIAATEEGGQLTLFNEVAVERATIRSKADGGGIHLKWGGTTGFIAAATERGGLVLTHNAEGEIIDSLPSKENLENGWETPPEEPE
jgi:hypothetical protein